MKPKQYKCHLDSDKRVLSSNGQEVTFEHGKIYNESHFIASFPNLFKEHLEVIQPQKKNAPKKRNNAPKKQKESEPIAEQEPKKEELVEPLKALSEHTEKSEFNWFRFGLLGASILVVSAISAYLRIHGIMSVFNVSLTTASVLVIGFIISEFSISTLMLREIKSKIHHAINMVVLGSIQILLLIISFIFEFSTMSNYIEKQKVGVSSNTETVQIVKNKIASYDEQIQSIQKQIEITPNDYIGKRARLTNQLNKAVEKKNKENDKLDDLINNKDTIQEKKDGVGFENTAKLLGVEEQTITKSIIMIIAGILNTLYLSFMYGFVSEWKRRK